MFDTTIEWGTQRHFRHTKNKRPADIKTKCKQLRSRVPLKYNQQREFFFKMEATLQTDMERLLDAQFEMQQS